MSSGLDQLLADIISFISEWEENYRNIPENHQNVINRLNNHLVHHTKIDPSKNLPEFIHQLKTIPINEMGFELTEYNSSKIITSEGYANSDLLEWYKKRLDKDEEEQELIKNFFFSCREEYKNTKDPKIIEKYSDVRSFINKENNIIDKVKINNLLGKYPKLSNEIFKNWYDPIKLNKDENYICPICGKLLSNAIFNEFGCTDMCMYYRDKESLKIPKFNNENNIAYKSLKKGIYRFTLIPGVSELRTYKKLSENFGYKSQITIYPEIDKFDISVEINERYLYLDVKDFVSPHELVESLIEKQAVDKIKTLKEEEVVYIVIPEHRKYLYKGGDYKKVVKDKLKEYGENEINIIYENQVYNKVGDFINEI